MLTFVSVARPMLVTVCGVRGVTDAAAARLLGRASDDRGFVPEVV
jgi:hypothetical protein